jgi:hypothetical protein
MRPSAPAQACKHKHLSHSHGANTAVRIPSTAQVRGPGKTMYRWRLGASHQSTAAAELRVSKRTLLAGLPGAALGTLLTSCWPAAADSTSAGKPFAPASCGACDVSNPLGYKCRCSNRSCCTFLSTISPYHALNLMHYLMVHVLGAGEDRGLASTLEQSVTEFTLPNGLHFITYRRTAAPIVSCHTYANVGAYDEVEGQTGGPQVC